MQPQPRTPSHGVGSGFIVSPDGLVLTNAHVVQDAAEVTVKLTDRREFKAKVIGTDPATDVAVLKVNERASALNPLPLGNSDTVEVGDPVVAIGNPFGLDRSVTAGIVSALQRQLSNTVGTSIYHVIQTDAAINHGNSGGPLLNDRGQVIGINSAILTGSTTEQGNVGVGFAVPINTVRKVEKQLIANGKVDRGFLGVSVASVSGRLSDLFRLPVSHGLLVQSVDNGSAADDAGLRAGNQNVVVSGKSFVLGGDIITAVDGHTVNTFEQLSNAISSKKPGDKVTLTIYRHGKQQTVTVTLGAQPK
jgi:S1-C subfamily serine protease